MKAVTNCRQQQDLNSLVLVKFKYKMMSSVKRQS